LCTSQDSVSEEAAAIDWASWEKTIKTPGLVAAFKDAHAKMTFPELQDTMTAGVKSSFASIREEAEKLAAESTATIVELNKEISQIEATKARLSDLTIDEAMELNPEIKAEVEKELKESDYSI